MSGKMITAIGVGGALALALIIGMWAFFTNISVTNEGNKQESGLNSQYLDNQNYLSDCIVKIRETSNVTGALADKFEAVMVEAVKGRYDGREANPGQMFSAVIEQYPDLKPLENAFNNVFTVVTGCRSDYRGKQTQLLDKLDKYTQWRTGSWKVRTFGGEDEFPSNNLVARVGSNSWRGMDAMDKMYQIVQVKDSVTAYETGELKPEEPFGSREKSHK